MFTCPCHCSTLCLPCSAQRGPVQYLLGLLQGFNFLCPAILSDIKILHHIITLCVKFSIVLGKAFQRFHCVTQVRMCLVQVLLCVSFGLGLGHDLSLKSFHSIIGICNKLLIRTLSVVL